jgi:hypothetical protein
MKKRPKDADTTSSRRHILLWVCVATLTIGTCTIAAQTINSKLKSKQITLRSFAVVPPKVEASKGKNEMTALGLSYLADHLASYVTEALTESGADAKQLPAEDNLKGKPELQPIKDLKVRYDTLVPQIQAKPKGIATGSFTLGEVAQKVSAIVPVDALVLVWATASTESKMSKPTWTRDSRSSDRVTLSVSFTYKSEVKAWYSIVDAKTGEVLYSFQARGKGPDDQTNQELKSAVKAAIQGLPR